MAAATAPWSNKSSSWCIPRGVDLCLVDERAENSREPEQQAPCTPPQAETATGHQPWPVFLAPAAFSPTGVGGSYPAQVRSEGGSAFTAYPQNQTQQQQQQQQQHLMWWWYMYSMSLVNGVPAGIMPPPPLAPGFQMPPLCNPKEFRPQGEILDQALLCREKVDGTSVVGRKRPQDGEGETAVLGRKSRRQQAPELRVCSNCHTSSSPFWRKDKDKGGSLCNACGLYFAKNDSPRPQTLWKRG